MCNFGGTAIRFQQPIIFLFMQNDLINFEIHVSDKYRRKFRLNKTPSMR